MYIATSNIVTAFDPKAIGSRVVSRTRFMDVLAYDDAWVVVAD